MQPLKEAVFDELHVAWEQSFVSSTERKALLEFSLVLSQLLFDIARPEVITKAFRKTGIYPFEERAPDYTKVNSQVPAIAS